MKKTKNDYMQELLLDAFVRQQTESLDTLLVNEPVEVNIVTKAFIANPGSAESLEDFLVQQDLDIEHLLNANLGIKNGYTLDAIKKGKHYEENPFCNVTLLAPVLKANQILLDIITDIKKVNINKKIKKELEQQGKKLGDQYYRIKSELYVQDRNYLKLYKDGIQVLPLLGAPAQHLWAAILLQLLGSERKESTYVKVEHRSLLKDIEEYNAKLDSAKKLLSEQKENDGYTEDLLDAIRFPDGFLTYNIFWNGRKKLEDLTFPLPCKEWKGSSVLAKALYKSVNKDLYYINPRLMFNGQRNAYATLKGVFPSYFRENLLSVWAEEEVTVEMFEKMCKSIPFYNDKQIKKTPIDKTIPILVYNPIEKTNVLQKQTDFTLYHVVKDKERYIKVYLDGIVPIFTLNKNGMLVLCDVLAQLLEGSRANDVVELHYTDTNFLFTPKKEGRTKKEIQMARYQAFRDGIKNCIDHSLICCGKTSQEYFINPIFFFCGNRANVRYTGFEKVKVPNI